MHATDPDEALTQLTEDPTGVGSPALEGILPFSKLTQLVAALVVLAEGDQLTPTPAQTPDVGIDLQADGVAVAEEVFDRPCELMTPIAGGGPHLERLDLGAQLPELGHGGHSARGMDA